MTTAREPEYRTPDGGRILLGESIGQGGEAVVYEVVGQADTLAKIYRTPPADYAIKLAWMVDHPPASEGSHIVLAWPTDLLLDQAGKLQGYLMPWVHDAVPLLIVFNPRKREQLLPNFNRLYRYRAARNLAAAVQSAHDAGYVVGDLNESNALVTSTALVSLLDTDSFQVRVPRRKNKKTKVFRSPVGKSEYTAPELQGLNFRDVDRQPEHDRFALGVLIFQLVMGGNHPFRLLWGGSGAPPDLADSIRQGWFPYSTDTPIVAPPPGAPELAALDPALVSLANRCFVEGHTDPSRRPTAAEWQRGLALAETALRTCVAGHPYPGHLPACPDCTAQSTTIRRPRSKTTLARHPAPEVASSSSGAPPPFGNLLPIRPSPPPPRPRARAAPAKKRPPWRLLLGTAIAILFVWNAVIGDGDSNQTRSNGGISAISTVRARSTLAARSTATALARSTIVARSTATARAQTAVDPLSPTATPNLAPRPGSLPGAWGGIDEFDDPASIEKSRLAGVTLAVTQGRLVMEIANPDQFYWLSYTDAPTNGRDFGFKVDIGQTAGDGEVILVARSIATNTEWAFAVNPERRRWQLYADTSDSRGFFVWITPRDYAWLTSAKLRSVELRISDSEPTLLINGVDVVTPLDLEAPEMAGDLIVGLGAATAPSSGATMTVEFERVDLYER